MFSSSILKIIAPHFIFAYIVATVYKHTFHMDTPTLGTTYTTQIIKKCDNYLH